MQAAHGGAGPDPLLCACHFRRVWLGAYRVRNESGRQRWSAGRGESAIHRLSGRLMCTCSNCTPHPAARGAPTLPAFAAPAQTNRTPTWAWASGSGTTALPLPKQTGMQTCPTPTTNTSPWHRAAEGAVGTPWTLQPWRTDISAAPIRVSCAAGAGGLPWLQPLAPAGVTAIRVHWHLPLCACKCDALLIPSPWPCFSPPGCSQATGISPASATAALRTRAAA